MSTYSTRLQPAVQNLLQHVVRFFHPRSSCPTTHISADVQRITLNASCMTISGERTEQLDILPRYWLYEWFSQFHRCGTDSILLRSPSFVLRGSLFSALHCWLWHQRADLFPRYIQDLLVVRDSQWKTPSAVLLCVCSSSSLLGDLLGVSRSVECDFLSILYYATFFFSFFTISSFIRDILLCCIFEFSACSLRRFSYQYL